MVGGRSLCDRSATLLGREGEMERRADKRGLFGQG